MIGITAGAYVGGLKVAGLPAGATFTLSSVGVPTGGHQQPQGVQIDGCQGLVHLSDLPSVAGGGAGIRVANSSSVTISNATLAGGVGVHCLDSALTIVNSTFSGRSTSFDVPFASPALDVIGSSSRVLVCGGSLRGGSALGYWGGPGTGAPAIRVVAGHLELRVTDQPLVVSAGSDAINGLSALDLWSGTSTAIDPAVQLVPNLTAPPIGGPGSYSIKALPGLATGSAMLGGTVNATLRSPFGDAFALFLGLPQVPVDYPFGALQVDLGTFVLLATGVQGPSGLFTVPVPVPSNPLLLGKAIAFQALSLSATTSALLLTNVAVPVLQ